MTEKDINIEGEETLEEAPIEEDPDADKNTENSDDAASAASSAAASEPSQTSQSDNSGSASQSIIDTALAYFGGSAANGDSADVIGTATTPDGNLYYKVNVIVSGIGYPLYVPESSDLYPLTPDAFNATYGGGDASQSVTDSSDASDDGGNAGDDGGNGGGYDGGYDGYYDYGGGPDHAEP